MMKCKVCGAESGKYFFCRECNEKKQRGKIFKCDLCGQWHISGQVCPAAQAGSTVDESYLYEIKKTLISKPEQEFYEALKGSLPVGFHVFPQINLATFIDRTDSARYQNELFRNIDFLITDENYRPRAAVEINDSSHLEKQRRERDEKVKNILEEAGLPLITLWTSYGVNPEYINRKIGEALNVPFVRQHHFQRQTAQPEKTPEQPEIKQFPMKSKKGGCYVATCVYGSYDCPQVWVLRRYRDFSLAQHWGGRLFIRMYYAVSPLIVRLFGKTKLFNAVWKRVLDRKICRLQRKGYAASPYRDSDFV